MKLFIFFLTLIINALMNSIVCISKSLMLHLRIDRLDIDIDLYIYIYIQIMSVNILVR